MFLHATKMKRRFFDDDARTTTTDARRVRQKDERDCKEVCSWGVEDVSGNTVFVYEDDVQHVNNNLKWQKKHAGLFSEEGGVKNFIASCKEHRITTNIWRSGSSTTKKQTNVSTSNESETGFCT